MSLKTIDLDGVIGDEYTNAAWLRGALADAKDVLLRIHSPGGSVAEGIAMHNLIRAHRRAGHQVSVHLHGIVASMATYVALAADDISTEDNALWMIHNPWSVAAGDHRAMQHAAQLLDRLRAVLSKRYASATGKATALIDQWMDDETWLFGEEIVQAGFAQRLTPAGDGAEDKHEALALGKASLAHLKQKLHTEEHALERLSAAVAQLAPPPQASAPEPDTQPTPEPESHTDPMPDPTPQETAPDTAGSAAVAQLAPPPQAIAPEPDTAATVAQAEQAAALAERSRILAIWQAFQKAHLPEHFERYVTEGHSIDAVRAALLDALAHRAPPDTRQTVVAAPAAAGWNTVIDTINARRK